jgi:ubiquinone/menaquinone biosynthesis C-methylase UbiE
VDARAEHGKNYEGVRHEDAEALSFPDNAFNWVVSNEVFEHVNEPVRALGECCRVLKPGGCLLFTIPFDTSKERSVRRARLENGGVTHLLPAAYHGNPLSEKGSLVFTDFGWDVLDDVRSAGFRDCAMHVYWSYEYGHLGGTQFFLSAQK